MTNQLSPDVVSAQAENELICEELLGWEKCCEESEPGWIDGWFWRMPDGTTTADAASFTTWAEAGLILDVLQSLSTAAAYSALQSLDAAFYNCRLTPAAIRAAALTYLKSIECKDCRESTSGSCVRHAALASDEHSTDLYYMQVTGHCGNSLLWWRDGKHGYTLDIQQAHVWTRDEAMRQHTLRPTEDFPWRKDYIDARLQHHVHCDVVDAQEGRSV